MKHIKTLLLAFVLLPLLVGTAMAAELTVVIIGSGYGQVDGGGLSCPAGDCEKEYPEKTVVQLKAFPIKGSRFVEWMVNGIPHEGVITIDQEDILVAARFESEEEPPNDLIYRWRDGSFPMEVLLSLDEVGVFLAPGYESHHQDVQQAVARHYHPQAEITQEHAGVLYLKRPDPVTQDQVPEILAELKTHPFIEQASPVFYWIFDVVEERFPPKGRGLATGEIDVAYPLSYTESQRQAIETEYGLEVIDEMFSTPERNEFSYKIENVLQTFEIANRLLNTGKVRSAYPNVTYPQVLLFNHPDDPLFHDQWHLRNTALLDQDEDRAHVNIIYADADGNPASVWDEMTDTGETIMRQRDRNIHITLQQEEYV